MLGGAKAALPSGGIELANMPSKGLLSNHPREVQRSKGHALKINLPKMLSLLKI
jgi:hypothetical protein